MSTHTEAPPGSATPSWLPRGRALTADDLDHAPDDGHRYELIDGLLIVSPGPITRHQIAVGNLYWELRSACPEGLRVLFAPYDVRLADDTVMQPDVIVAREEDLAAKNLPVSPRLAVEVLSPSTRGVDLLLKRDRLERAGCPSYWVLDPEAERLLAWELDDAGRYREVADLGPDDTWTAQQPYPVEVTPRTLCA